MGQGQRHAIILIVTAIITRLNVILVRTTITTLNSNRLVSIVMMIIEIMKAVITLKAVVTIVIMLVIRMMSMGVSLYQSSRLINSRYGILPNKKTDSREKVKLVCNCAHSLKCC